MEYHRKNTSENIINELSKKMYDLSHYLLYVSENVQIDNHPFADKILVNLRMSLEYANGVLATSKYINDTNLYYNYEESNMLNKTKLAVDPRIPKTDLKNEQTEQIKPINKCISSPKYSPIPRHDIYNEKHLFEMSPKELSNLNLKDPEFIKDTKIFNLSLDIRKCKPFYFTKYDLEIFIKINHDSKFYTRNNAYILISEYIISTDGYLYRYDNENDFYYPAVYQNKLLCWNINSKENSNYFMQYKEINKTYKIYEKPYYKPYYENDQFTNYEYYDREKNSNYPNDQHIDENNINYF